MRRLLFLFLIFFPLYSALPKTSFHVQGLSQ
jgi:hypothetical protein